MATLQIKDLHVAVEDEETHQQKEILKGVNLEMKDRKSTRLNSSH